LPTSTLVSHSFPKPLNRILAALPATEYKRLSSYLEYVSLTPGQILHDVGDIMNEVYFPEEGMISLVSIMSDGSTTEIGIVGKEGMTGLPVIFDGGQTTSRSIVQIKGSALKLPAKIIKQEFDRGEELYKLLLLYIQARLTQVAQTAACNRQHIIELRLARWLLMVSDCVRSEQLNLTQEFIANMLGTRRSGVTVAASRLQKAGTISYHRGHIKIIDRQKLETCSCECYQIWRNEYFRLFGSKF
jgi:CRP-like cAMP-binding protein